MRLFGSGRCGEAIAFRASGFGCDNGVCSCACVYWMIDKFFFGFFVVIEGCLIEILGKLSFFRCGS